MSTPFVPHQPEEQILVKISRKEAALIQKLRKHAFGQFVVHKIGGTLVRVEITSSQMIEAETEIDL
jgi:hypothetical protein